LRNHAKYRVLERRDVKGDDGVTSDQIIKFTSHRASQYNLKPVRRVGFYDAEAKKHYCFFTNHMDWDARTIADIYKQRWQVELFFKWIKQNLKIKSFLGNNDNAVMTPVMIALCTYLILSFLKFTGRIALSLQQITRLVHVNLFIRRDLMDLLKPPKDPDRLANQGSLI
jgi:putative transposase